MLLSHAPMKAWWFAWSLLLLALPLQAQERRRPALHWSRSAAAASCIDPRGLAERVEALTGPVFVGASDAEVSIEGHIDVRVGGGYRARINVTASDGLPAGERVLEHLAEDCRTFDKALSFVIALTIDPDLDLERATAPFAHSEQAPAEVLLAELEQAPPQPAEALQAAPSVEERDLPVQSETKPEDREPPSARWELGAAVLASRGELPRPGLGVALSLDWQAAKYLSFAWWNRASFALEERELGVAGSLGAQSYVSALLACSRWQVTSLIRTGLCLGPELGLVRASAQGLAKSRSAVLSSYGGVLRLHVGLALNARWKLDALGFAGLNVADRRFVYEVGEERFEAYRLARLRAGAALGVSRAF